MEDLLVKKTLDRTNFVVTELNAGCKVQLLNCGWGREHTAPRELPRSISHETRWHHRSSAGRAEAPEVFQSCWASIVILPMLLQLVRGKIKAEVELMRFQLVRGEVER
jgi:hypothetical protein